MTDARMIEPQTTRSLPHLRDETRPFWTGGADGELLIQYCAACERWQHPPQPSCTTCGAPPEPRAVSGRGTVFTFTVNHQPFNPDVPTPYDVAIVTLDEQDDLRIITNIVNCDVDSIEIGMPVRVLFEDHGDVKVPVFEPATG